MAYLGGDTSAYKIRLGGNFQREDADGKTFIYAHAGASATANVPKMLVLNSSASGGGIGVGYFATAPADTGLSSLTAAIYLNKTHVGIPPRTVPSDTDGWFQIGGVYTGVQTGTSVDHYINGGMIWKDAAFICSGTVNYSFIIVTENAPACFGISLSSVSQGTYDWYLFGQGACGVT